MRASVAKGGDPIGDAWSDAWIRRRSSELIAKGQPVRGIAGQEPGALEVIVPDDDVSLRGGPSPAGTEGDDRDP